MNDITTVGAAVGMLNAAFGAFKHVRELSSGSGDLNLKESVAELYEKLLDVKQKLFELEDENRNLKQQLEVKAEVERRPPFGYWFKKGDDDPFCPVCYEKDEKLIHLDAPYRDRDTPGYVSRSCRVCGHHYYEQTPY